MATIRITEEGQEVRYHGSLSGYHGTWIFAGYCCSECMPAGEELAEARFVLCSPAGGQLLKHVSGSSFTALPRPEGTGR